MSFMDSAHSLRIGQIVESTEAEGPGLRFAIWTQGCPLRCPGCCNPEFLTEGGNWIAIDELVDRIKLVRAQEPIEGITLLGGEPLAQIEAIAELAERCRAVDLSVMIFSGYTLEEILDMPNASVPRLLLFTDILVDGPYMRDLPDTQRRWIGSTNQKIHFLSQRYRADEPCWRRANTLEIRLIEGELSVNGFPAPQAKPLWRRLQPLRS
jgi:anaerobic ribonucleoside-triphosphate reductase activating protein